MNVGPTDSKHTQDIPPGNTVDSSAHGAQEIPTFRQLLNSPKFIYGAELVTTRGYGEYRPLQLRQLPPLFVAYDPARAEISEVAHRNLRALWEAGDQAVVSSMSKFRDLTDQGKEALLKSDWDALGKVMNANYDLRRTIMDIPPENHRMIEVARANGASAHFTGSGGAIIGLYRDEEHYQKLCQALGQIRCTVIKPIIYG